MRQLPPAKERFEDSFRRLMPQQTNRRRLAFGEPFSGKEPFIAAIVDKRNQPRANENAQMVLCQPKGKAKR